MFLILKFRVVIDCGTAPQKWRSAAHSIWGLEGRRIWECQCDVSWSWSGSVSGGNGKAGCCITHPACSALLGNSAICWFSSSAAVFCTLCIQPSPFLTLGWGNSELLSSVLSCLPLFAICPLHCALARKGGCVHAIPVPCKTQFVLCSHGISCLVSSTSPALTLFS